MGLKENIKIMRKSHGKTLEDVARYIGVARQTVQKYESGLVSNIPSTTIEKLAEFFGCTPAYLMGWTDDPHDSPTNKDNASLPLPAQEQKHIEVYRKLNAEGKERVDSYTNDLADNPKYTIVQANDKGQSMDIVQMFRNANANTAQVAAFGGNGVQTIPHKFTQEELDEIDRILAEHRKNKGNNG